jgi:undecaprenyl-diphosphatase
MLERFDQNIFLTLNSYHSPFWDQVMHAVSGIAIWIPLYVAILIALYFKYQRKFFVIIIFIAFAATLSDQLSVMLKFAVHRLRPCHEPYLNGLVHVVRNECGGLYSFVSSHATNSFDVAVLSLSLIRKRWYSFFIIFWALTVSYSRIYLGVHYPGDVLCGSLLGSLIGWTMYKLYALTDKKLLMNKTFFNNTDI